MKIGTLIKLLELEDANAEIMVATDSEMNEVYAIGNIAIEKDGKHLVIIPDEFNLGDEKWKKARLN